MLNQIEEEVYYDMEIKTTAEATCSWCCAVKSVEFDNTGLESRKNAAKVLAQAFTHAKDEQAIGIACKQCMATGTLTEVKDANE